MSDSSETWSKAASARAVALPWVLAALTLALFVWLFGRLADWHVDADAPAVDVSPVSESLSRSPLSPLPIDVVAQTPKSELGKRLFHETRLSADSTLSCASCHDLNSNGADSRRVSVGIQGRVGTMNAPTVFNARYNFAQFWNGRARTLKEQAAGPITSHAEMASDWSGVIARLGTDAQYRSAFQTVYGGDISADTITDAIAAFERTLVTPNSRFDRYLNGDRSALNQLERKGYRLFLDLGCVSCHQGIGIGGNLFQPFGVMADSPDLEASRLPSVASGGGTGGGASELYKVPSLRNVAVTAPYFHDGSVGSLHDAVVIMARVQLGRRLSDAEAKALVAYLGSLTGQWQGRNLTAGGQP